MNFFKDFGKNSTLQDILHLTALEHITACLFSFEVAYRPARHILGASSAMRPSSAGIQVISVLVFLRLKSYLLQFDEFFSIGASDMTCCVIFLYVSKR